MLGLFFSSKLDWGSYFVSIAKTTSKKIGTLIHSMNFLLSLFCISTNLSYGLALNTVVMYGLVLLATTWKYYIGYKNIYKTVGPSLAATLKPLVHHRNVDSLSLSCRYYFGKYSSELDEIIPRPYS